MRFNVLGDVSVDLDGAVVPLGGPQQRRLLALLLCERGRVVSTDRIVEALWSGDEPPPGAPRSAMKYVSRLRAVLGETVIVTVGAGYRLELGGHECDVVEFEALVDAAGDELPDVAVAHYDAALDLWRGPAYGEFGQEWWALPEVARLTERLVAARVACAETRMTMGHHNRAIADLEQLAVEHPLDERPVRLLMQALQATGRQAEALRAGQALRRRLVEETGLSPSSDLAGLETAIASGQASAGTPTGRPLRGYTIHEAIGEGAHGRVYAATQPGTERRVAVKVIRPDLADSTEFVHRFEAEAQLVARLEHPHIVPLYDYWREPGGAYLVFRLLSAGTARDSMISGGPWSLPRVARLVDEIGAALMSAHGAGVVHNDVKSSNVLLDDDGAAYLTDFGIASAADGRGAGVAADIAGLGWVAWELLSGSQPPSTRSHQSVAAPPASARMPSLVGRMPSVPDGLDAVLRRAVEDRYGSMAEFVLAWRSATEVVEGQHSPLTSDARRIAARQLADATAAGVNPYRGLRPFDEADIATFHGRADAIAELIELVGARRFVAVVGASGSGKSSVVLAGLIPRLRSSGAVVVTMLPGDAPLEALRTALRDVATVADEVDAGDTAAALSDIAGRTGRMIIVVDQFEECWTRARPDQRDEFLDVVAGAAAHDSNDVRFVTTVRADLLDRPLEHPATGPLMSAGTFVLAPLSPAELEEAIVCPALQAGVSFDDGVVARLIAEAVTYPGSLPLLQFTLTELYDRRRDAVIGPSALEEIGGMSGAIGRRAEEVFAGLDDPMQPEAQALFGRLVALGAGAPDTRRRAVWSELSSAMREVADRFVAARLLVADRDPATREPTVEVAHEALLTRWSRLVDWVEGDRRWLMQLQHLAAAARAWDQAGRPDTELYRGSRLESVIEALDVDGRTVSELENQFVEAGRRARDSEFRAARRTARRLRRLLTAAAAALVVALVAGAVAVAQRGQAEDSAAEARAQTERAETAATAAKIEALVGRAESLRQTQRDVAALLAVEAFRLADTPRTRSALLGTFTEDPGFMDVHRSPTGRFAAGIVMPDGMTAFMVDEGGRLRPYELDTGEVGEALAPIGDLTDGTSILAASDDGRWIAHALHTEPGGPTAVGVFDTHDGSPAFPPTTVDGAVWSLAFTPGADALALAIDEEARVLVVDRATGAARASAPGVIVPDRGGEVALEPQLGDAGPARRPPAVAVHDGELIVTAADGSLRVFDATSYELRRRFELAPDTLASIHPLSDGSLLTAGRRGISRVDLRDGRTLWRHDQGLSNVGDGSSGATCAHLAVVERLASFFCGNAFGRLVQHDLVSGFATRVLDVQNGNSGSLWTARDATELVSFGDNEPVVSRWRLDGSGPITHLTTPGFRVWSFSPSGDRILVEREDPLDPGYTTAVLDAESGDVVRTLEGFFNPDWLDDDTLTGAVINDAGEVQVARVDIASGTLTTDSFIVDRPPSSANLDTGKERTLVVHRDGSDTTLLQFDPHALTGGPEIAVDGLVSAAISSSGHRIAAGTVRGVVIHDGFTAEQVAELPGTDLRGVFITVTDQLFVSSLGGELTQYDLDTLEQIRSFGGSRGHITQLLGTADGGLIATNADHEVVLSDVATGLRVGTPIHIPDGESNWIALSLDGRWLSAGGEADDGSHATQVWSLDPERWMVAACEVAGRNLTLEEWTSTIGDLAPYRATCPGFPSDLD